MSRITPAFRGTPDHEPSPLTLGGITPAFAGSTLSGPPIPWSSWDHPRIRGEHGVWRGPERVSVGSPPHSRGALDALDGLEAVDRITPAFAGSTSLSQDWPPQRRDHPRIRGEHNARCLCRASRLGSPPHSRGALQSPVELALWQGITPAFAGSTWNHPSVSTRHRDHPRIRGEHIHRYRGHRTIEGSPPHSRGAHQNKWMSQTRGTSHGIITKRTIKI